MIKITKYSGNTTCFPGETLVYRPDGSVTTVRELFAGVVKTGCPPGPGQNVEFFALNTKDKCPYCGSPKND